MEGVDGILPGLVDLGAIYPNPTLLCWIPTAINPPLWLFGNGKTSFPICLCLVLVPLGTSKMKGVFLLKSVIRIGEMTISLTHTLR